MKESLAFFNKTLINLNSFRSKTRVPSPNAPIFLVPWKGIVELTPPVKGSERHVASVLDYIRMPSRHTLNSNYPRYICIYILQGLQSKKQHIIYQSLELVSNYSTYPLNWTVFDQICQLSWLSSIDMRFKSYQFWLTTFQFWGNEDGTLFSTYVPILPTPHISGLHSFVFLYLPGVQLSALALILA